MGDGEFFPFQLTTKESGQHPLLFWLDEVTYNSKIFTPYGKTAFTIKDQNVLNDLQAVEKQVRSMNLFPETEYKSFLKTTQSNYHGKSYTFTSVQTKVTEKTGIFEENKESSLEDLQSASTRKASAILVCSGIFRNDKTKTYHITSRLA